MKQFLNTFLIAWAFLFLVFTISGYAPKNITISFQKIFIDSTDSSTQKNKLLIDSIKKYIVYIDSLIEHDDSDKYISKGIEEGIIEQSIKITTKHKRKKKKMNRKGGFGKYTYADPTWNTVYKIKYHDNIDKNFYEIYYYKNNILIAAIIDYQENGIPFYRKYEYYDDDKILKVEESKKEMEIKYTNRVDFDLHKKGAKYLETFLKMEK